MKRRVAQLDGEKHYREQDALTAGTVPVVEPELPELEELPVVVSIGPAVNNALGRSAPLPPWDRGELPPLPVYPGVVRRPVKERWEE